MNSVERGSFLLKENGALLGEMEIGITGRNLTVYHTEIKRNGNGIKTTHSFGLKLIDAMVIYAREQELKVIPLCPYVYARFKKHPDLYKDVWNKKLPLVL